MSSKQYHFSGKSVYYYFGETIRNLNKYTDPAGTILIVDDQVNHFHGDLLEGWKKVVVQGKESSKDIRVVENVVHELIRLEADRKTRLVGIGGGVVTDLTGFVACTYMRGISFAFVPTTLLAQVDASIGGKNGIDFGGFKNILGIIRQPDFLLFDFDLLETLPEQEWYNGFSEIIKYACICDAGLFTFLNKNKQKALSHDRETISFLIERSAEIKSKIVEEDELEGNKRRLLNFGHTVGHAVERIEDIPHGQAVAKGMKMSAVFSEKLSGLSADEKEKIVQLIQDYHLPVEIRCHSDAIAQYFTMDKKREEHAIHFILLKEIGKAEIRLLPIEQITKLLDDNLALEKN